MDFKLLETTRVDPDGSIFLLDRHIHRLAASAVHFGFPCDCDLIRARLIEESASQPKPSRIRLVLDASGNLDIQFGPMPAEGALKLARLSGVRVSSSDPLLRHKTTARQVYDSARTGCSEDMDAILANELGQLTETTIANFAVQRDGRWITPPIACGLLPGTLRAQQLESGAIEEGIISTADLIAGEVIRCFNSVRGIYDLRYVGT